MVVDPLLKNDRKTDVFIGFLVVVSFGTPDVTNEGFGFTVEVVLSFCPQRYSVVISGLHFPLFIILLMDDKGNWHEWAQIFLVSFLRIAS